VEDAHRADSGQANIEMAVRATKLGALDFWRKPLSTDKLLVTVENALRLTRLEDENRELRQRLGKHELIGSGAAMARLTAQIERVAASETRVCILGETGTGKELVARAIHEKSPRRENAFVTLNCAAVPAELIESELFGHEKGAFTGAAAKHAGKFEQADGGTLFLDEIAICPWPCRRSCCECWKRARSNEWRRQAHSRERARACGDAPQSRRAGEAECVPPRPVPSRVCLPLPLPPLRERPEDFPSLSGISQGRWPRKHVEREISPTMRLQSCGATVGREMCANSAM